MNRIKLPDWMYLRLLIFCFYLFVCVVVEVMAGKQLPLLNKLIPSLIATVYMHYVLKKGGY